MSLSTQHKPMIPFRKEKGSTGSPVAFCFVIFSWITWGVSLNPSRSRTDSTAVPACNCIHWAEASSATSSLNAWNHRTLSPKATWVNASPPSLSQRPPTHDQTNPKWPLRYYWKLYQPAGNSWCIYI